MSRTKMDTYNMSKIAESIQRARMKRNEKAAALKTALEKAETMQHSLEMNNSLKVTSGNTLHIVNKEMDMDRALVAARALYQATGDIELKGVMDRAELCWGKWRDESEYCALMQVCSDVMSQLF